MDMAKLNEIAGMLDEASALKKHIDGMSAECEAIKQYCMDALQDLHDTFCAVCDMIEKNPQIAHNYSKEDNTMWLGNSSLGGGTGFQYGRNAHGGEGRYVDYIGYNKESDLRGFFRCFRIGEQMTESAMEKVKQVLSKRSTSGNCIKQWLIIKVWGEETRRMSEALLEGVRISAEHYRDELKEMMNKGVTESARKYTKVA